MVGVTKSNWKELERERLLQEISWNSLGVIGKTTKDHIRITDVPSEIRNGYFPTKST